MQDRKITDKPLTQEWMYLLSLMLVPGIGSNTAKTLLSYCGSAEAIFKTPKTRLIKIPSVGEATAQAIKEFSDFKRAEEELQFIDKYKITPICYTDEHYPSRLKQINKSPFVLFYKGSTDLNASKVVAVVGTRNATEYGKVFTEKLMEGLSSTGCLIISGLAYGIDIAAHKAALKYNLPTIGVVAHGLDMLYPATHKSTAAKMLENGGLLTEYMSKTNPDKGNFPDRNQIIAALSDCVVVVEASEKGGALITAEYANSFNRDVFALPGKVHDEFSKGCNRLIKNNKAALIESASDLKNLMGWEENKPATKPQRQLLLNLTTTEQAIIDVLTEPERLHIDELCNRLNYNSNELALVLLNLEFNGLIKSLPGNFYMRT